MVIAGGLVWKLGFLKAWDIQLLEETVLTPLGTFQTGCIKTEFRTVPFFSVWRCVHKSENITFTD